eukprot:2246917-Rhodomonas_salina.2
MPGYRAPRCDDNRVPGAILFEIGIPSAAPGREQNLAKAALGISSWAVLWWNTKNSQSPA